MFTFSSECHHPYGLSTTPQRACSSQLGRPSPVRSNYRFVKIPSHDDDDPSDDEYRLLRQNLFEQYSGYASVPVESPLVPITANIQRGCKPLAFIPQA